MTYSFRLSALACASLASLSLSNAWAQNAVPQQTAEIVITGNPLGRDSTTVPVSTLGRADLLERGQSTLGETLNGLPGVSSTYFGPNASRPTIRGLDGDRIRVLNNSASSLDASALSYDHAVPVDALSGELRLRHLVRFSQKGQFNLPPVRFTQVYAPQHQAQEAKAALGQVTVN